MLTYLLTYKHTDMQTYRHAEIQSYRHACIHTYIPAITYIHTHLRMYVKLAYMCRHVWSCISACIHVYVNMYTHRQPRADTETLCIYAQLAVLYARVSVFLRVHVCTD